MANDPVQNILLLQRFGFGPRAGEAEAVADVRERLIAEVEARQSPDVHLPMTPSVNAVLAEVEEFRTETRKKREATELADMRRSAEASGMLGPPMPAPTPGSYAQAVYRDGVNAVMTAAYHAPLGYAERLAWFWSNHFAISVSKSSAVRAIAAEYERSAIRAHVFGRFEDMLLAVARHPAMLMFLDQRQSIGPNSRAGQRRARGLNENLAREILELHTLGVSGGYSQADVTSLAKMLTGWTIVGPQDEDGDIGLFTFNRNRHEPGQQTLLGKVYADGGQGQADAALRDIARHPSTANFIAHKLARHFIADEPPAALVASLADVFRKTGGDLAAVSRALLTANEALAPPGKIRSPLEFIVSALRATAREAEAGSLFGPMRALAQTLWQPGGPNGFADTAAAWLHPEGMKVRMEVASQFARQSKVQGNPNELLGQIVGPAASSETRQSVSRAESRAQGVALLLMSPEFQKR